MVQGAPLASVIIVNHNGIDFVDTCLCSVLKSDYENLEVIFVDNASTDGSLQYVNNAFGNDQRLKFVENSSSFGPAVGRNRGSRIANGKYLIFLDNDTKVTPNWITELVGVLEKDVSIGAAQAKLLRMDTNLYDCAGDYLGPLGFLIERSRGREDKGQLDFTADILSAKSAASIIRKELFDRIGRFDEDFYMYLEETDLSWRVWLAGYRVVFIPNSNVYHAFATPEKSFSRYYSKYIVRYYGCRNYISTLVKNLEPINLIKILPFHIGCWLLLAIFFSLKGNFDDAFYILKGIGSSILDINQLFRKRHFINANVKVIKDRDILNKIMDKKEISYYLGKAFAYLTGRLF